MFVMLYIENQEQVSYMTSALSLSKREFTCHGHVGVCVPVCEYVNVLSQISLSSKGPETQAHNVRILDLTSSQATTKLRPVGGGLCGLTKNKKRGLGRWSSGQSVDHANSQKSHAQSPCLWLWHWEVETGRF